MANKFYNLELNTVVDIANNTKLKFKNLIQLDNTSSITIQLTDECNLRCKYCYEIKKKNKITLGFSDVEYIKDYIKNIIKRKKKDNDLTISFYGGEPILEIDLIKNIVAFCNSLNYIIKYSLTTNGTLLNETNISYFIENRFNLGISLDLNQEIHNKNRVFKNNRGSYDVVKRNIDLIKKIDFGYYKENVRILATLERLDIPNIMSRNVIDENIEITPILKSDEIENAEIIESILKNRSKLTNINFRYIDNLFEKYNEIKDNGDGKLSILDIQLYIGLKAIYEREALQKEINIGGICFPLGDFTLIKPNGEFSVCEKILYDLKIGDLEKGINREITEQVSEQYIEFKSKECYGCWIKNLCTLCLAQVERKGTSFRLNKYNCLNEKIAQERYLKSYVYLLDTKHPEEINNFFSDKIFKHT